ncbi:MCE family protein [Nocardioides sp.]|jgi:phospholipid/cholesterol/gamma-HCH transport system substrate-binding protein|uniref:MCE family protein n=1 Tax=Nocardioides sp. TaxID=35761 RepID=UPI0031FEBB2B|nr:virulence factor Mce family protein [Nocardioides sp.]
MLVNIYHDTPREHGRLMVAGVGFLTVIALLIGLSIAVYQKKFETVTMVTIKADRAGLQLAKFGDVRINGVLIGQVREISQDGEQASIKVALQPSAAREIPENVRVEILPTTLFGQKFVSFVRPDAPSAAHLQNGDVIPSDRVETNVELSKILADLFPLLRSIQPADLNKTLNALATALSGRGKQLGTTLDELDAYLGKIDDHLPTLRQDLVKLAQVANTYDQAAPDLLGLLRNLTVTSQTVLDNKQQLGVFFSDLQGLAKTSTRVLQENGSNLIRVGQVTEPVLRLLAVYSPELPCLLEGAARYAPRLAKTFSGNQVKQYIEFGTAQYRPYDERDRPVYGEVGHGPWCLGLPNAKVPAPPIALDQGSNMDEHPPTSPLPSQLGLGRGVTSGYAGTDGDKAIINALLAGKTGRTADSFGSMGSLMYGPVVRGSDLG